MSAPVDTIDQLIAKPKPKADVRHLMGRPLVPFFVPGREEENVTLAYAAETSADGLDPLMTIPVREFRDGYFLDAQQTQVVPHGGNSAPAASAQARAATSAVKSGARGVKGSRSQNCAQAKAKGSASTPAIVASSKYAGAAFCNTPAPSQVPMPNLLCFQRAAHASSSSSSSSSSSPTVDFPDVSKPSAATVPTASPSIPHVMEGNTGVVASSHAIKTAAPMPSFASPTPSRTKLYFLGAAPTATQGSSAGTGKKTVKIEIPLAAPTVRSHSPVLTLAHMLQQHTEPMNHVVRSPSGSSTTSDGSPLFGSAVVSPPDAHEPSLRQLSVSLKQLLSVQC